MNVRPVASSFWRSARRLTVAPLTRSALSPPAAAFHQSRPVRSEGAKDGPILSSQPPRKTKRAKAVEFSVDRSNLYQFAPPQDDPALPKVAKEAPTPLAKDLLSYIKLKGPVTLHDFMSQAANHLVHGYYQAPTEKIGARGDFVTAPELSQLFGEMVGLYCVLQWQKMGSPARLQLIECGPGKGTLMADVLRVSRRFPRFAAAVRVHFVELSQNLRSRQWATLQALQSEQPPAAAAAAAVDAEAQAPPPRIEDNAPRALRLAADAPEVAVSWHSFLSQVPGAEATGAAEACVVIGQEFLDAFPVHQFAYTDKGWRERLVDIDASQTSPLHFRFVLSPNETPAIKSLLSTGHTAALFRSGGVFVQGLPDKSAKAAGRGARQPATSGGYLVDAAGQPLHQQTPSAATSPLRAGDGLEIAPLALATVEDIAKRLARAPAHSAALLIDYGEDFTQEDSLRAFLNHRQVHALSQPGVADVTADVDFRQCRRVVEKVNEDEAKKREARLKLGQADAAAPRSLVVPPLQTQGEFLMALGIVRRVQRLIDEPSTTEEAANQLFASLKMLVDPAQMGKRFKVMQIETVVASASEPRPPQPQPLPLPQPQPAQ